jgi:hypothetical protein
MEQQPFYWEIKDVLTQFVSAMDGCIVNRYNENRSSRERVTVKYVYAPKLRLMMDIINQNSNMTLPVVAIDLKSIARDPSRVFNKNDSFVQNSSRSNQPSSITQFRTPVPVKLQVSVSILAGFQLDLEQIASNFIAYFNPYITLAYKVPSAVGPEYDLEVRSKATWDGTLAISTPDTQSHAEKFRRTGDTSFTIDTWIYPEAVDSTKPIYYIDSKFYAIGTSVIDPFSTLSGQNFTLSSYPSGAQHVDAFYLSGTPTISNAYYTTSGQTIALENDVNNKLTFNGYMQRYVLLYGHNFDKLDGVMLSANSSSLYGPRTSVSFEYMSALSGVPLSSYTVLNPNMLQVSIPYPTLISSDDTAYNLFDIVTYNKAGWDSTYHVSNNFQWGPTVYPPS